MKPTLRATALCVAVTLAAAMSSAAWAQPERRDPHQPSPEFQAMREAHERQRAQDLRTILRLRPDQEAALTAFLQSHGPPMPPEGRGPPAEAPFPEALTTPQRLDAMARREAMHAQARQRRTDAVRAFYAALGPDQRQVFDALMRTQGGDERGGWGGHRFGGPHGPRQGPPGGPPRG